MVYQRFLIEVVRSTPRTARMRGDRWSQIGLAFTLVFVEVVDAVVCVVLALNQPPNKSLTSSFVPP